MFASVTMPMSRLIALGKYHSCAATILGSIPISCNVRSHGGKGVMLAKFAASALWASCASTSVYYACLPLMQMPIGTLSTLPPDYFITELWDDYIAQVQVGCMIPLLLKRLVQGRDVWTCLLWFQLSIQACDEGGPKLA